tara:strand:+ start:62 stop:346 length:285 start_codon:yes stop_codon:yes gene_type:complete
MNEDWFDEVVDGKPEEAEYWQIDYIDSILPRTSLTINDQEKISFKIFNKEFTKLEAEELITYLKDNEIKTDPRDQYQQFKRNGMFDDYYNKKLQ